MILKLPLTQSCTYLSGFAHYFFFSVCFYNDIGVNIQIFFLVFSLAIQAFFDVALHRFIKWATLFSSNLPPGYYCLDSALFWKFLSVNLYIPWLWVTLINFKKKKILFLQYPISFCMIASPKGSAKDRKELTAVNNSGIVTVRKYWRSLFLADKEDLLFSFYGYLGLSF